MSDEHVCAKCNSHYAKETIICVKCGINLVTGESLRTDTSAAEEEEPPLTGGQRLLMFIAQWMPGMLRPSVLIASILLTLVGAALVVLCLALFTAGVMLTAFPVGAVGLIAYAQALAWMLGGQFLLLHEALTEFDSRAWSAFFVLFFAPLAIALAVAKSYAPVND